MFQKKITAAELVLCALFTALIAIGAFIKIPIPVVPFTLQFLFTMLAGLLLGPRSGAISVGVYIALGLMGLPIFAEGGGFAYIFKPSFGYLIGFCIASAVTGAIANKVENPSYKRLLSANFTGLAIVYLLGMLYYYLICNYLIDASISIPTLLLYCFVMAVPGDIVLCILSAGIAKRLIPMRKKQGK